MRAVVVVVAIGCPIVAQDASELGPDRWRLGTALAAGTFDFVQGRSPVLSFPMPAGTSTLDGRTSAWLLRLQGEFVGGDHIGGGVRFESMASANSRFTGPFDFDVRDARDHSAFAHLTWRVDMERFAMPIRVGALANRLEVEYSRAGGPREDDFTSFGPYFELAPEWSLAGAHGSRWSLYAEGGIGWTATRIGGTPGSFPSDATTRFVGVEVGTRLEIGTFEVGAFEVGLAYVARFQRMERSDPEAGVTISPFDAQFQGVLVSFAVRF